MMQMRALVTIQGGSAAIQDVTRPQIGQGELLIKVTALAQNPTDWKTMAASVPGRIVGCDFCGTIEEVKGGSWQRGQRVAGFVHGSSAHPQRGAFAEYLVTEHDAVYPVPGGTTDEQAAAIPLALATALQVLFLRLGLPEPLKPAETPIAVLINGGTTSVGKYSIQLCKMANLSVIATGSKRNHQLLSELGADYCIDYKDSDWPEQIRKLTHDKLRHAFDCVSDDNTTKLTSQAISTQGGHVVRLLPVRHDASVPLNVKIESTNVHTVFGRALNKPGFDNVDGDRPQEKAFWIKYLQLLPEFLISGKLQPNKIKHLDGGLDAIMSGFQMQKDGKVSAEKLCYSLI